MSQTEWSGSITTASYSEKISNLTQYPDINEILLSFVEGIMGILTDNICGIFLTGSLSYGDFNENSSDIDITVILKNPATSDDLIRIKEFHSQLEKDHEKWAKRLECSYFPSKMLANILPPVEPRPWYCGFESRLYEKAPFGNEWIINNYLLYNYSIPLLGPDFKELTSPIKIEEVQKACIRDLFVEWKPKINNFTYLNNSHFQAYLILNLCRILYTVLNKATGSKKTSAEWVKQVLDPQWKDLIDLAERWQYGKEMNEDEKTIKFIRFAIKKVSRTEVFEELKDEIEAIINQQGE